MKKNEETEQSRARGQMAQQDAYLDERLSEGGREELKDRATRFVVDVNDLMGEIARQAGTYAYFSHVLASHETISAKAKLNLDAVEAKLKTIIRNNDPRSGRSGGPTNDQVEAQVRGSSEWIEAAAGLKNAQDRVAHLSADVVASAQKAAMLKLLVSLTEAERRMKGYIKAGESE